MVRSDPSRRQRSARTLTLQTTDQTRQKDTDICDATRESTPRRETARNTFRARPAAEAETGPPRRPTPNAAAPPAQHTKQTPRAGKTSYWDERYTKDPEPFDWYQRYSGIQELLQKYVKKDDAVLMAGCGNSRLSEDMFEDGFANISNVDISRVVIDQMGDKYKDKPALTFQQMNVCSLEFPDESFDAVIVKGTMDAILCGEGSTANVAKMCMEVSRVLKPSGILFVVSYGVPDNLMQYLENEDRPGRSRRTTVLQAHGLRDGGARYERRGRACYRHIRVRCHMATLERGLVCFPGKTLVLTPVLPP